MSRLLKENSTRAHNNNCCCVCVLTETKVLGVECSWRWSLLCSCVRTVLGARCLRGRDKTASTEPRVRSSPQIMDKEKEREQEKVKVNLFSLKMIIPLRHEWSLIVCLYQNQHVHSYNAQYKIKKNSKYTQTPNTQYFGCWVFFFHVFLHVSVLKFNCGKSKVCVKLECTISQVAYSMSQMEPYDVCQLISAEY